MIDKILEYREIEKLRSTYAEGLGGLVDPETRARAHDVRADRRRDGSIVEPRSEPAEHPDPHAARSARSAARSSRARRTGARRGGLLADRAARARACVAGPRAARRVPLRRRHPPPHGRRGVRCGRERGDARAARRREDAQLRDHLRHEQLRSRVADADAARGSAALHRRVLQAVRPGAALRRSRRRRSASSRATSRRSSDDGATSRT